MASIYRRKDGYWCGSIVYTDKTGIKKRVYRYSKVKKHVLQKLYDLETNLFKGFLLF